jgi:hypothetical protein
MVKAKNRKGLRILLIVLSALVVCVLVAAAWFSNRYKGILRKELPGMVARATDSLYRVSFHDIELNILTQRVRVVGLRLYPDTTRFTQLRESWHLPLRVYDISLPQAEARGVGWLGMLTGRKLSIGQLHLREPDLIVHATGADSVIASAAPDKNAGAIDQLVLKRIDILSPRVRLSASGNTDTNTMKLSGNITVTGIVWKQAAEQDSAAAVDIGGLVLEVDSFTQRKTEGLYRFHTGAIRFDDRTGELKVSDMDLQPSVSREVFYQKVGQQKEIYTLHFPSLIVRELAWRELLQTQQVFAGGAELWDPRLTILMNRMQPPNTQSKMGKYPHQLLQQLGLPIWIPEIRIQNGTFTYTEINEKTKRAGDVPMHKVSGTIGNVTNVPDSVRVNNTCTIALQGIIMGGGNLRADFALWLDSPEGKFTVSAKHGPMDGRLLNPTISALALARLEQMQLTGMDLFVEGDEHAGRGRFSIRYQDLKVILESVDEKGAASRKGVMSFLTNNLMIYPHNPMPGEPVREVTTSVERDPYKSFFNLIWKNIFSGALQTALRSENMAGNIEQRSNAAKP